MTKFLKAFRLAKSYVPEDSKTYREDLKFELNIQLKYI